MKGLKYCRNNFNSLELTTCVKMVNILPLNLRSSSSEINEIALDLIKLVYQY